MASIILKGSERTAMPGARDRSRANPAERLEVTVVLHCRALVSLKERIARLASPHAVPYLTREQFAAEHGAETSAVAAVRAFAATNGIAVVDENPARRAVVLSGTVAQFEAAFEVELMHVEHPDGSYRGREGPIYIPEGLAASVLAVLGLDNRPQAMTHFRTRPPTRSARSRAATPVPTSYTPPELATLYGFPDGTGDGQCVALIELGGGYRPADLDAYFTDLGVGSPQVSAISVDHGKNGPTGDPNGADGEVMLDVEVVGAIAPQARIVVYFAPNTDAGFLDAITTAVHDTTNRPNVISISWGGPESSWTSQAMSSFNSAFEAAAAMGITVCVASGDNGSSDGVTTGGEHVDFPASSPFALACGGTSLTATSTAITSEAVWNDGASGGASGGGVSTFFELPAWQAGLKTAASAASTSALTMRGVPDVAGNADPETGYKVRIDGTNTVIGGTSAVAPLWAALVARLNQAAARPVGDFHALLYQNAAALRDITQGNNGDFAAAPGWDACTGLGSPNGTALAKLLLKAAERS